MEKKIFQESLDYCIIKRKNERLCMVFDDNNYVIVDGDTIEFSCITANLNELEKFIVNKNIKRESEETDVKENTLIIKLFNRREYIIEFNDIIYIDDSPSYEDYFIYSNELVKAELSSFDYIDTHNASVTDKELKKLKLLDYPDFNNKSKEIIYKGRTYTLCAIVPVDVAMYFKAKNTLLFKSKILGEKFVDVCLFGDEDTINLIRKIKKFIDLAIDLFSRLVG